MATQDKPFTLEVNNFRTLNAFDNPRSIADDECAELLGFMPVGRSLKTTPTHGGTATITPNKTYTRFIDIKIGELVYYLAFSSDGCLTLFASNFTLIGSQAGFSDPRFVAWKSRFFLIIDPTAGYWSVDGTGIFTAIDASIKGNEIAVFQERVFIVNAKTISYSSPGTYSDWNPANGAGAVEDAYASIQAAIKRLVVNGENLYVIGDFAIHLLVGITLTLGNDTFEGYRVVEAIPGVGCYYPDTVQVYKDQIYFVDRSLLHIVSGVSVASIRIPDARLDTGVPLQAGFAFFARIYGITTYCIPVIYDSGNNAQAFLCYAEGRWFWVPMCDVALSGPGLVSFTAALTSTIGTYPDFVYGIFKEAVEGKARITVLFAGVIADTMRRRIKTKSLGNGTTTKDKQATKAGASIAIEDSGESYNFSPTIQVVSGISSDVVSPPVPVKGDDGSILLASSVNARGKTVAIKFEDTGVGRQYSVTGLIIEGVMGVDW